MTLYRNISGSKQYNNNLETYTVFYTCYQNATMVNESKIKFS